MVTKEEDPAFTLGALFGECEVKILVFIIVITPVVRILIRPTIFEFRVAFEGVLLLGLCCGELRTNYSSSDKQSNDNNETFDPGCQLNI